MESIKCRRSKRVLERGYSRRYFWTDEDGVDVEASCNVVLDTTDSKSTVHRRRAHGSLRPTTPPQQETSSQHPVVCKKQIRQLIIRTVEISPWGKKKPRARLQRKCGDHRVLKCRVSIFKNSEANRNKADGGERRHRSRSECGGNKESKRDIDKLGDSNKVPISLGPCTPAERSEQMAVVGPRGQFSVRFASAVQKINEIHQDSFSSTTICYEQHRHQKHGSYTESRQCSNQEQARAKGCSFSRSDVFQGDQEAVYALMRSQTTALLAPTATCHAGCLTESAPSFIPDTEAQENPTNETTPKMCGPSAEELLGTAMGSSQQEWLNDGDNDNQRPFYHDNKPDRLSSLRSHMRRDVEVPEFDNQPPPKVKRKKHRPKVKRDFPKKKGVRKGPTANQRSTTPQGAGFQDTAKQLAKQITNLGAGHEFLGSTVQMENTSTSGFEDMWGQLPDTVNNAGAGYECCRSNVQFDNRSPINSYKQPTMQMLLHTISGDNNHLQLRAPAVSMLSNSASLPDHRNLCYSLLANQDYRTLTHCQSSSYTSFPNQYYRTLDGHSCEWNYNILWPIYLQPLLLYPNNCCEERLPLSCPNNYEQRLPLPAASGPSFYDFLHIERDELIGDQSREQSQPPVHEPQPLRLASEGVVGNELALYTNCCRQLEAWQSQECDLSLSLAPSPQASSPQASATVSSKLVSSCKRFTKSVIKLASVSTNDQLQMVPYCKREIVLARGGNPFRKLRPNVLLDEKSQKIWLLLKNGEEETINFEKERAVMKFQVESFIQKMQHVQGNRCFSPWKGSVVDSVVGAFLTQNVSDHLSSSAFMSIASRFPAVSKHDTQDMCSAKSSRAQSHATHLPLGLERVSPVSSVLAEEIPSYGSAFTNINRLLDDPSMCALIDGSEVTHQSLSDNKPLELLFCGEQDNFAPAVDDNQTVGTFDFEGKEQNFSVPDDGRASSSPVEHPDLLKDAQESVASEAWCHRTMVYERPNVCRRLRFHSEAGPGNQDSLASAALERADDQACYNSHAASDVLSDQQSETGTAITVSGSMQSGQDSNSDLVVVLENSKELGLQEQFETEQSNCMSIEKKEISMNWTGQGELKASHSVAIQEINKDMSSQGNTLYESEKPLSMPKTVKKRSLSSMSGPERAQLEASQPGRKKNCHRDWESVRKQVVGTPSFTDGDSDVEQTRVHNTQDAVDWEAVRLADLKDLAETIKERGMHHVLSGRIKAFLTTLYYEHGSTDLEWLRRIDPKDARDYLMSLHGLGVKSVECIRLLTLHHVAFPVDTNVGRICVRLGWVPLESLPEELQLHLLELYPIQEQVQAFLWPRLCTLDQKTLYELHYQLITFGKVFCTKSKPNCNACPMRTDCKHFASAYASAKPRLTWPDAKKPESAVAKTACKPLPVCSAGQGEKHMIEYPHWEISQLSSSARAPLVAEVDGDMYGQSFSSQFFVEEPPSPERADIEDIIDLEDMGTNLPYIYNNACDYSEELLAGNMSVLSETSPSLNHHHQYNPLCGGPETFHEQVGLLTKSTELNDSLSFSAGIQSHSSSECSNHELAVPSPVKPSPFSDSYTAIETPSYETDILPGASSAIIMVPEGARLPAPKLKNIGRLRTVHYVYELPDWHPLLQEVAAETLEKDDPCSYLLAIWSPGEVPDSQEGVAELCREESCASCNRSDYANTETVAGTLLIPCRTAMRGRFPLNGTYFQVNEVFADYASSLNPLQVARSLIWKLKRRFVYFGTSIPNIFRGLSREEITNCFLYGHVCVRAFDRKTRAPKPLLARFHFPISKQQQSKRMAKKSEQMIEQLQLHSTKNAERLQIQGGSLCSMVSEPATRI